VKAKIKEHIQKRINEEISTRSSIKYLKNYDLDDYLNEVISVVYLYTRVKKGPQRIWFTETICAIGHAVRNKLKQKKNSSLAAKTGAFFLWSFENMGFLKAVLTNGDNGHGQYIIEVIDDEALMMLWETVRVDTVERLPSTIPHDDWIKTNHSTGIPMVKTGSQKVLDSLNPIDKPMLFECLNKAQKVGWKINTLIADIQSWALRNKAEAFDDIWKQINPEARATKLREAKAIGSIATKLRDTTFYHLYYYDFRGRKYPTSAYLHEQGSDVARGLLLRADSAIIGNDGFFWLLVSIANNWAGDAGRSDELKTDKIPLKDRFLWAQDNEEILLSYAESPKVNQGWMKADKPWQFLAACFELAKLRSWQMTEGTGINDYNYASSLECYIDGSNNGSQHLAALTCDEETAVHVNLVPSDLPGDLYLYVADHVWSIIDSSIELMSKNDLEACQNYIDTLLDLKKQIQQTEPNSDIRKQLVESLNIFKESHESLATKSAIVFWHGINDSKERRKIVKRNVMTLPYGGTRYGLGQQQIDDAKKHGIEKLFHMEYKWGAVMGRLVWDACRTSLKRPMQLLTVFENAGKQADAAGEFLEWTVPITNFPVVQYYTEGVTKKTWVLYGPPDEFLNGKPHHSNELQLHVCFIEDQVISKGKQAQGAAPNIIHSFDAGHLTLTVNKCDFPVTTIHDSFGCLLADMPSLYRTVREAFVEFYDALPLGSVIEEIQGDISEIQLGTLDLSLVLDSEYCFV
jgi:DNA-directed RNA polymerase